MTTETTRILLLSANPKDTDQLSINEEFREIREGLNLSQNRNLFDIKQGGATRAKDLRRLIFSFNPHIVHFSGHSSKDGIFLENDSGHYNSVTGYALANLFSLFADTVQCVLLNACYSREQAIEIVQQIPYVIGMSTRIRDDAAIQFAIGFYDAIGAGRSIEDAYKFGCNAIQLESGNYSRGSERSLSLPADRADKSQTYNDIDESDKPVLLTRVREIKSDSTKSANDDRQKQPATSTTQGVKATKAASSRQAESSVSSSQHTESQQHTNVTNSGNKTQLWGAIGLLILVLLSGLLFWIYDKKSTINNHPSEAVQQLSPVAPVTDKMTNKTPIETGQQQSENNSTSQTTNQLNSASSGNTDGHLPKPASPKSKETKQQIKTVEKQPRPDMQQPDHRKEPLKEELSKKREKIKQEKAAIARKKAAEKAAIARQQAAEKAEIARRLAAERVRQKRLEEQKRRQAAIQAEQKKQARQGALVPAPAPKEPAPPPPRQNQQSPQKPPAAKESKSDRMVKEVEELWFEH